MTDQQYLTPEGKVALEKELQELKDVRRPDIAKKIQEAVAEGDLKENADYHDAREKLGFIEGRIQEIEQTLRHAIVVEKRDTDRIQVGSTVTLREDGEDVDEVFTVVGAREANPSEGKISNESPLGQALLGKRKNEKAVITTPDGSTITFKIRKVE
ncbi:MAG: transcription elongation factor GreA [Phototrophicaceae bacterium]